MKVEGMEGRQGGREGGFKMGKGGGGEREEGRVEGFGDKEIRSFQF